MKSLHVAMLVGVLALVGCSRESPKGGPGKTTTTTDSGRTVTREDSFKVQVPTGGTNVTQGKRQEVDISLNRNGDFKQAVKLKFDAPAGLKVVPAEATIKSGDNKTNVFVEAEEGAPVGRHSITVTGIPETGDATSVKMDIDVKKK